MQIMRHLSEGCPCSMSLRHLIILRVAIGGEIRGREAEMPYRVGERAKGESDRLLIEGYGW